MDINHCRKCHFFWSCPIRIYDNFDGYDENCKYYTHWQSETAKELLASRELDGPEHALKRRKNVYEIEKNDYEIGW